MSMMISEGYDAFVSAGAPEDKARKAAETLSGHDARLATKADLSLLATKD